MQYQGSDEEVGRSKTYESQIYQVSLTVLEARQLVLTNTNVIVSVSIGTRRKCARSKTTRTDSPFFNEYFVFNFNLPLLHLLEKIMTLRIYENSTFLHGKILIGLCKVEIGTIWAQPNHQFYHKWAVLTNPRDPTGGIKGYLQVDMCVLGVGDTFKSPEQEISGDIEGNLLVPAGSINERQRARFIINIYKGDGFETRQSPQERGDEEVKIKPYINVLFGGKFGKTESGSESKAEWNEELVFVDVFPPLFKYIHFQLKDGRIGVRQNTIAVCTLDLHDISHEGELGFLPTFGPDYLYFYGPCDMVHYFDIKSLDKKFVLKQKQNSDYSFSYKGRLLISLRTELINYGIEIEPSIRTEIRSQPIKPLKEDIFWDYKEHILIVVFFDMFFFNSKESDKPIFIKLTHGPRQTNKNKGDRLNRAVVLHEHSTTTKQTPTCGSYGSYIIYPGNFPCLHITSSWPDKRNRVQINNLIRNIKQRLKTKLLKIQESIELENKIETKMLLQEAIVELVKNCKEFLKHLKRIQINGGDSLDRERVRTCEMELQGIVKEQKGIRKDKNVSMEKRLQDIYKYVKILKRYVLDPHQSYPNLELWIIEDQTEKAHYVIPIQNIMHASFPEGCGKDCGQVQSVLMRKETTMYAKIEILAWFGLLENINECLDLLPSAYQFLNDNENLSKFITFEEVHTFQCRVHIFQGRIKPGADTTGLADSFVGVILPGKQKKTSVRKQTLNPVWDETLLFPKVVVYGTADFIKYNSLTVCIEVMNEDKHGETELIGIGLTQAVVKLKTDPYTKPHFPPKLIWLPVYSTGKETAQVLLAAELLELPSSDDVIYRLPENKISETFVLSIPEDIRPHIVGYRLEIVFWGLRALKKLNHKLFIVIECSNMSAKSSVLNNPKQHSNFSDSIQFLEINLPLEEEYVPPLIINLYQIKSFGRITHTGAAIISNVRKFICHLMGDSERRLLMKVQTKVHLENNRALKLEKEKLHKKIKKKSEITIKYRLSILFEEFLYKVLSICQKKQGKKRKRDQRNAYVTERDWWSKYQASKRDPSMNNEIETETATFKIYTEELEAQPEFEDFQDVLKQFQIVRGKMKPSIVQESNVVGKFKGIMKIYRWPKPEPEYKTVEGFDPSEGLLSQFPKNEAVYLTVRVYIVRALNLTPQDINGKADPYLQVHLGSKKVDTKDNVIQNELNPEFGQCFEFRACFPHDYLLTIKVMDYDLMKCDDLIGQTTIDLENRFYSKHRATCGLQNRYEEIGYNSWHDITFPTEILSHLCKQSMLKQPVYSKNTVRIGQYVFTVPSVQKEDYWKEIQALSTLHRWYEIPLKGFHLVPEHIETRSLYRPDQPGVEQGKLEMWVDIFAADPLSLPPVVNITPRPAEDLELRVIIWNTMNVELKDMNIFYGEQMSDIYVVGWMTSPAELQKTDIHYHSLHGEGNFNWRFVFNFKYFSIENKVMLIKKGLPIFAEKEAKVPCKLELQVWDNNTITTDAFIGSLTLNLAEMPRGVKLAKRCNLSQLEPNVPTINLFQIRQTRGWWPFRNISDTATSNEDYELTGKVELEMEILTLDEAEEHPVGKGRDEPDALPPPKRPDISFNWLMNPLRTLRYVICRQFGFYILVIILIALLLLFLWKGITAVPEFSVKKWLNA